jgi:type I restriction enzyme R subunit
MKVSERQLEDELIDKLEGLKYVYRPDIRDRASLERNFREKIEALNRVKLTDAESYRLLDEIITRDVRERLASTDNPFSDSKPCPIN